MIGIRREDKNEWERRVPLTPDHVTGLVENHGLSIVVQPFRRRAFADSDYRKAGAELNEDLSGCDLILGVKETPIDQISPRKVYVCFSHTTKGQGYNMPTIRRLLDLGCTLIDYEHVVDERGRRLIFFGRHAGYAGMIDSLWALGRRFAAEGLPTPFERVRLAHDYSSLDEATRHISWIGEDLRRAGLPPEIQPVVCGFTGSGNVTHGALEIIQRLPTIDLVAEELDEVMRDENLPRNVVFTVKFKRDQRYVHRSGGGGDPDDLDTHPDRYESGLPRWLHHLTALVNGAFWRPPQPRLLTREDLRCLWGRPGRPRLRVIADISCDIDGAIETTIKATTPGDPVYVFDLDRDEALDGVEGNGPVMMTVDNLPCQLPKESSQHFGDTLVRFVPALARCDWARPLAELNLPEAIERAVVIHRGELTPGFAYVQEYLESS